MKTDNYQIERATLENYDGTKTTCYCVKHNGEEVQILHYCTFEKLIAYFTAIDEDIKRVRKA